MKRAPGNPAPGDLPSASDERSIRAHLRSLRPVSTPDIRMVWTSGGFKAFFNRRVTAGATGTAVTPMWAPGDINQEAQTIPVASGYLLQGVRNPILVQGASVTVTGGSTTDPHFVVLQYVYNGPAEIITLATASYPVSQPNVFRCALHSVARVNGVVMHVRQHQFSDLLIPGFA